MTEAYAYPQVESGRGWTALVYLDRIELRCSKRGDPLPEALRILLPASDRHQWACTWIDLDVHDRDFWLLEYDPLSTGHDHLSIRAELQGDVMCLHHNLVTAPVRILRS